jgi:putative ABC transport system permease protein
VLAILRRARMESEMDAELRFHIEARAEDLIRSGVPREEALRRARIEFGGMELTKEECRDARGTNLIESLLQDIRFGLRMLRKSPGFTAVAILTLALGIGANTAIFSYVDAWMIKPLPYPHADRLMTLDSHDKKKGWTSNGIVSTASFLDFEKQNTSFEQIALWTSWNFNLTGDGAPELVEGGRVSWNYFAALGAKAMLGRTFAADEDRAGAPHVAILSQGLWHGRFASDPNIIGRNITIEGEPYTVVGVMPGTFQFPLMGIANLWTPLALTDKERADRSSAWLAGFGQLKPNVTPGQAGAESAAIFGRLEKQFPETNTNLTLLVKSMGDEIGKEEGTTQVTICLAIVGLVLLIACANVANLMLARATGRTKEFAVRGALGAAKSRLARQLMTESLLLFLFGGVAGMIFGIWGVRWIEAQIPGHVRGYIVNYGHVDLDFTTLGFTLGISILCGLLFGLAPAFENSRLDVNRTLKEVSRDASGGRRHARLRKVFVAAEVALAVVVLISTSLLVESFVISVRSSPGYNAANVMVAQVALPKTKYAEEWRQRNFSEAALANIRALPQAASVGAASSVPYGGFGQLVEVEAVDKPAPQPEEKLNARFTAVSRDYLSTMQIGLIRGRLFDSADEQGNPPSVIINQTFARQFWPDEDPIGRQVRFGEQHKVGTIVGVVNDIKMYYVRARAERQMYVPLAQFPSATLGFVVRTASTSDAMAPAIRNAVWAVDRDQPISSVEALEGLIAIQNSGELVLAKLMVFFGVLAMFLGMIGIYGVIAHLVSQRLHEIGIRMALGASPAQVMRMVTGQGLKLALIGVTVGVLGALGTTKSLAAALYQVSPSDPPTFLGVAILFSGVALAACWIPARRAMRVDPMVALRYE